MALIHELHGILIEQNEILAQGQAKTLELLKRLKEGKVKLADVELTATGWKITEPKPKKAARKSRAIGRRG